MDQVLLHVGRDRAGRRRLSEIAVLRQTDTGRVRAVTVWHADDGGDADTTALSQLLRRRVPV